MAWPIEGFPWGGWLRFVVMELVINWGVLAGLMRAESARVPAGFPMTGLGVTPAYVDWPVVLWWFFVDREFVSTEGGSGTGGYWGVG